MTKEQDIQVVDLEDQAWKSKQKHMKQQSDLELQKVFFAFAESSSFQSRDHAHYLAAALGELRRRGFKIQINGTDHHTFWCELAPKEEAIK